MYKYLLKSRGRSVGAQPPGYYDWIDYDDRTPVVTPGGQVVRAWGELYYMRELTRDEVKEFELYPCGETEE